MRDVTGVTVMRRNFAAVDCPNDTCSYLYDGVLPNGSYTWFVIASNDLTAIRSIRGRFTVAFPGRSTLQAPINGVQVTPLPTFSWTDLATANEYRLTVIRNNTGLVYFRTPWLNETAVCTGGVCSFTPSEPFRQGGFSWFIESRATGIPNTMKTGRSAFRVIP
ncbi:MAG: hypothetical protein MUF87_11045 [Anaerolineae bacterium]|nr:hypothetical protein [Anaerolineae bacterium]